MYVYKITNKVNGKCYVGQTVKKINERFCEHMGKHSQEKDTKFYRAVRKYGRENFYVELLDTANSQEELNEKEFYWIQKLNTVKNGYNSLNLKGKCGGDTLTNHPNLQEIRKHLSQQKLGANNPRSKPVKATNVLTGEVFVYGSAGECVRELGFSSHTSITRRCSGVVKTKRPYKGKWLFESV